MLSSLRDPRSPVSRGYSHSRWGTAAGPMLLTKCRAEKWHRPCRLALPWPSWVQDCPSRPSEDWGSHSSPGPWERRAGGGGHQKGLLWRQGKG